MLSWDEFFLGLAKYVTCKSKDPTTKVGAVVVGATNNEVAFGFNGLPPGIADDDRLLDRDWKNFNTVHAEMNALAYCKFKPVTLYSTHFPCHRCAVHILSHRTITRVVSPTPSGEYLQRWGESMKLTEALFKEAGVEIVFFNQRT
jgi:dCMP deaminase